MTVKIIKCNVNNEYNSSSAVERVLNYERIEEDKREIKKREEIAFILN